MPRHLAFVAVALLLLTTGCGGEEPGSSGGAPDSTAAATDASTEATTSSATDASDATTAGEGPEESFRTWLAASREPDAATACDYLTPALVRRMVAQLQQDGWPGIDDCASMTEATASLYAAAGSSTDVDLEVEQHDARRAVLDVRYRDTGKCGIVVLRPGTGHWVITEQSEQRC